MTNHTSTKKITLSKAKERAWNAFSLWVRQRGATGNVNVCITCGRIKPVSARGGLQAGHFIPGRHNAILFDERGVHPQCDTCNRILGGNGPYYYEWMLKNYGLKVIKELKRLSQTTVKYTVDDYLAIEDKYKKLLK